MSTVSFGAAGAGAGRAPWRPGRTVAATLGAMLAVAGAAALAGLPWQQAATHLAARSWPVAEARILSVSLFEERRVDPRSGSLLAELVLSVAYEFEVAGEAVAGDRAGLSDHAGPHDRHLQTLYRRLNFARLTGRTVPVAYDPGNPARAYLDTGFAWKAAALRDALGLAAVLAGLGLALRPLSRTGPGGAPSPSAPDAPAARSGPCRPSCASR